MGRVYAAKIDDNQKEIVEALRKNGATVQSLSGVGKGVPDLLVGFNNKTLLIEVKDGRKSPSHRRLTEDQIKWHGQWRGGPLAIVSDVESALMMLKMLQP